MKTEREKTAGRILDVWMVLRRGEKIDAKTQKALAATLFECAKFLTDEQAAVDRFFDREIDISLTTE